MAKLAEKLTDKKEKDVRILADFVHIFCRESHRSARKSEFSIKDEQLRRSLDGLLLCDDCQKLLAHGIVKRLQCPYDPNKPMCKRCKTHCYAPGYREKMRKVMRFSGLYLLRHGRLDLIFHYYL